MMISGKRTAIGLYSEKHLLSTWLNHKHRRGNSFIEETLRLITEQKARVFLLFFVINLVIDEYTGGNIYGSN